MSSLRRLYLAYCAAIIVTFDLIASTASRLTDVTLGWGVSWIIGPGRPAPGTYESVSHLLITVVVIMVNFGLVSCIGGGLGRLARIVFVRSAPAGERSSP